MKKVLLLGSGYGIFSFIKSLDNSYFKKLEFTLVSPTDYHYHTVLLYKTIATGENVCFNFNDILPKEIKVIQDEVVKITENEVVLKNQTLSGFDYIISGLGFSSESFGIKGVGEHTLSITNYDSGIKIYNHIESKLKQFNIDKDEDNLSFVICGGGLTGVESASELALSMSESCRKYNIDFKKIKIILIEAAPNIIPMFSKNLLEKAYKRLKDLGVDVKVNSKILECSKNAINIDYQGETKTIKANTIIWTAGVKGNQVIQNSFLKNSRSKIEVGSDFLPIDKSSKKHFFVGDNCVIKNIHTGNFYPPTAQVTIQQGRFLAKNFPDILEGKEIKNVFSYKMKASFCSLGEGYAIGDLFGISLSGKSAAFFKSLIEWLWKNRIRAGF